MAWSAAAALLDGRDAVEAVGRPAADLLGVPAGWPARPDEWHARAEVRHRGGRRSRRRLPGALAAVIDACLEPGPAARPTIGRLAGTFEALPPSRRR